MNDLSDFAHLQLPPEQIIECWIELHKKLTSTTIHYTMPLTEENRQLLRSMGYTFTEPVEQEGKP